MKIFFLHLTADSKAFWVKHAPQCLGRDGLVGICLKHCTRLATTSATKS